MVYFCFIKQNPLPALVWCSKMAGVEGLEPTTRRTKICCSSQLSYTPVKIGNLQIYILETISVNGDGNKFFKKYLSLFPVFISFSIWGALRGGLTRILSLFG
jgi:hypothetical protein